MPPEPFVPCEGIYLLNHSVGRPPQSLRGHIDHAFHTPWEEGDGDPWRSWLAVIEDFRAALAQLFHGRLEDFCPQTNLSSALTKIVGSLPPPPGRETILLSEDDFPSMGFVLQQAQRLGWRCRFLTAGGHLLDPDYWRREMSQDVGLVFITQVQSTSSRLAPVTEITRLAREHGVISVVDVAQSAGVIPIDLREWQADFVIGSCVKWLCGGPGAGWLWADAPVAERCQPLDLGWFSHENPFEMEIRDFRFHSGALRFWGGTPSVLPAVTATAGIRLLDGIGIDQVRAHNLAWTQALIDSVEPGHLRSPALPAERGGTVVLHFGPRQEQIATRLREAQVRFDARVHGLRLSPHLGNGLEQLGTVLECLK